MFLIAHRIGVVETMLVLGMLFGSLSSSYVYAFGGYLTVFGVSAFCNFLALLYVIFVIVESVPNIESNQVRTYLNLNNLLIGM